LTTLSLSLHLLQMEQGEGDPRGGALNVEWNTSYKALFKQLARHELSPSSSGMLVKMISFNVSELLPLFDDKQNKALTTMDEYFILDPTKPPREVIQFVELEVLANASRAEAAKAVEAHAKECLQALILFFSDNLSERGVGVSPVESDFTAGGSAAQAALAGAVSQDPANKRKAAAVLAAAGRPHGENSAAINTEANTAQTRLRQAFPLEGEVNARRGAFFPLTHASGRVIVRVGRCFGFPGSRSVSPHALPC
jgi:hypothetical protein